MVRFVLILILVIGVHSRGLPEEDNDVTNVHGDRSGDQADDIDCTDCQKGVDLRSGDTTKIRTHRVSESSVEDFELVSKKSNRRERDNQRSHKGSEERSKQRKRQRNKNLRGYSSRRKKPFLISGGVRIKVTSSKTVDEETDRKLQTSDRITTWRHSMVNNKEKTKSDLSDKGADSALSGKGRDPVEGHVDKHAKLSANIPKEETRSTAKEVKQSESVTSQKYLETEDNVRVLGEKLSSSLNPRKKKAKQSVNKNKSKDRLEIEDTYENEKGKLGNNLKVVESGESEVKIKSAARTNKLKDKKKVKAKDQLPAEDVETNRPDDDRWRGRGFKAVPDVARLEQRLHPRVDKPVGDIIHSLGKMLRLLQSSIGKVDHEYHYIFNSTRYTLMLGVRQKLMDLSQENNNVYDIVMETSLLTKQVYRRAHEQRTNGHYPLRLVANDMEAVNHLNLRQYHVAVREELRKAQILKDFVNRQLGHKGRLHSKYMEVERRVQERLPRRALLDLIRRANQTIQALQTTPILFDVMNGANLREHARNDSTLGMRSSWILIQDSKHVLKEARDLSKVNRRLAEELKKKRSSNGGTGRSGSPFDDTRMMLWVKVDGANFHADKLLQESAMFMMKLKPLIERAKGVTSGSPRSQGDVVYTISGHLKSQTQTLSSTLNDIRRYFGIEIPIVDMDEILEASGVGSGDSDMTDSEPTIEGSGDGFDLDGSGEIDQDYVDFIVTNGTAEKVDSKPNNTFTATTIIDGLDEEDFFEEKTKEAKEVKTTTLAPTTTTGKETDDESEDGGFDFTDMFGFFNDEPAKDESIHLGDGIISSVKSSLNELIRKELSNFSQESHQLSEPANKAKATTEELSHTLAKVKKRVDVVEGRVGTIQSFISLLGAKKAEYTALIDRVQDVSRDIDLKVPIIEKQCNEAVTKAFKKRDRMRKSLENQGPSVGDAPDPEEIIKVKATIEKVQSNVQEISKLRQVAANPCEAIQKFDFNFRTNISELRKKVERAKLIAASLPISVSVKGEAHISLPLPPVLQSGSPLETSIKATVKPTENDGSVLAVKTNDSVSVMVVMEGLFPKLAVLDSYDYILDTVTATDALTPGAWYTFIVDRLSRTYSLKVLDIATNAIATNASIHSDEIPYSQGRPSTLYLGGVTSDFPELGSRSWDGCVGDVEVNGHNLPILTKDSEGQYPTGCTSIHHISRKRDSWLFDGTGNAHFSLDHIFRTRHLDSVEMTFIPQSDGVILSLQMESMRTRLIVQVTDGTLSVQVKHHRKVINKVSAGHVHGFKQSLEIRFVRGVPELISGRTDLKTSDTDDAISYDSEYKGLYVGGFGDYNSSFQGCIHSLLINKKQVPFENILSGHGIHQGHCQETTCVTFSDGSQPVQFPDVENGESVSITFTYGSLGPLLEYSWGKKFKVTVSITTSGLEMSESVKEDDTDIDLDNLEPGDPVVLLIRDDREEKTITFEAGGSEETVEYGSSAWKPAWGGGASEEDDDEDGSYSLTIGTSSDVNGILDGTVRDIAIGGRLFNKQLMEQAKTHGLETCVFEKSAAPSIEDMQEIDTRNVC